MVIIKLITTLFIQMDFWNGVRDLVLSPFDSAKVELFMVMLVIPFFVNVRQQNGFYLNKMIKLLLLQILIFWVTDNFLMRHKRLPRSVSSDKTAETSLFERVKVRYRALHTKNPLRMHLDESDESEVLLSDEELGEPNEPHVVAAVKRQQRNSLSSLT